eukprot:gene20510-biopygen16123
MSGVGPPATRPRTRSAGGDPFAWRRRPLPALRPHMSGVGAPAIRPHPRHVPLPRGSSPPGVVRGRIIRPFGAHGQCRVRRLQAHVWPKGKPPYMYPCWRWV